MHPREDLRGFLPARPAGGFDLGHDRPMGGKVLLEVVMVVRTVGHRGRSAVNGYFYLFIGGLLAKVVQQLHLYVPYLLVGPVPVLVGGLHGLRFGHYQYRGLFLTAFPPFVLPVVFPEFLCDPVTVLLVGHRLEEALVELDLVAQLVIVVPFPHGISYFVQHVPDRLVIKVPQLPLYLQSGKALFGPGGHYHPEIPVMVGQLGAVQQSAAFQSGPVLAFFAMILVPGRYPRVFPVPAPLAHHTLFISLRLEMGLATGLVREFCEKISNLHIHLPDGQVYIFNYQ